MSERVEEIRRGMNEWHSHAPEAHCDNDFSCQDIRDLLTALAQAERERDSLRAERQGAFEAADTIAVREMRRANQAESDRDRAEARTRTLEAALEEAGLLVGRFRSHQAHCRAACTCDAIMSEKELRTEVNRVIQRAALARPTPTPAGEQG